ncbi:MULTISPECIES: GAF domain-containing sensor histidine kinase [unclassified Nitrospina]|uniref:GAF domain-containing sensor histidine kinase n=1 Tax=unclassified Nitrospina TaxID=2638683 RepID=UPI003F9CC91A
METGKKNLENKKQNSAENEIRQRTQEYRVLHEVAKTLHSSTDMKSMLIDTITVLTRFEELEVENKAGIFLVNEEEQKMELYCTIGTFSEEFLNKEKEIPLGQCLCGRVAESGEMIVSDSCFTDSRHENKFQDMTDHGHYIVPLKNKGRIIGVLFLYTDPNPPWYVRSKEILMSIGGLIADAIVSCRREEEIVESNQKLKRLNELKNQFLGIASHDLRNPIYVIQTFSEVLKNGTVGTINPKQKELLEKVYKSSNFMRGLLDNLLDISKIESGQIKLNKKSHDLNLVVKQQVEMAQMLADKKNIAIISNLESNDPFLFDENAITQAIMNFIGNAIKFSPVNSIITVSTKNKDQNIEFSVKDEGPGLSEEDQKLLFKEFQTLSAKPTGGEKTTGLGLAITKKLVSLHSGKVGVNSELGKGACFFFVIPFLKNE